MRGLGLGVVVALCMACGLKTFVCASDGQCGAGEEVCTEEGFCAFPDGSCASGLRYGQFAGGFSGECVPLGDGSTGGEGSSATTPVSTSSSASGTTIVDMSTSSESTSAMPMTSAVATTTSTGSGEDTCGNGLESCPDGCVDTSKDPTNCGACGIVCDLDCIESECLTSKLVFVTSSVFNGAFGGLDAADAACQQLAQDAGQRGVFMAWLSDDAGTPVTRMTGHDGPYVLVDGTMIAETWDELRDGELLAPIALTELGTDPLDGFVCAGQEVWTNTSALGSLVSSVDDCGNWTTTNANSVVGRWSAFDERWTEDATCPDVSCASGLPIYCVEQ